MKLKEEINLSTLLLLPLLVDENLTANDLFDNLNLNICRQTLSFVNAYNYDINDPNNINTTFILFDFKIDDKYVIRSNKLKALNNYKSNSFYKINKKDYLLYRFSISKKLFDDYKNLEKGLYASVSFDTKAKILSFWGGYKKQIDDILRIFRGLIIQPIYDEIGEDESTKCSRKEYIENIKESPYKFIV